MDLEENYPAFNFSDQQLLAAPFCKINDEVWTVQDFKTALISHPLVFRKIEIKNRLKGSHTCFDIYLDSLRSVYDAKIEINQPLFKMLRLTSVPMIVTRPDLPYKIPTPAFPVLTDNDNLGYSCLRK